MSPKNDTDRTAKLEKENLRLLRAVEELSTINEIATAINSTMDLDKIVDLIVQKCVKHLNVEQAAVMLLADEEEEKPFQTMIRKADRSMTNILPYRLDTQLTGWMLKNRQPLLVNDFPNDDRFQGIAEETFSLRSMISVPLQLKGRMIGLITAFNKKTEEGFTTENQRLLSIIATQSAQVIENARLYIEEQALIHMKEEVRLASDIQLGLLPKTSPKLPGYDIAGVSYPAQVVGGDYFDFITVDEERLAVCVGDISGKGLPAALLMANLQATIRGQTLLKPPPKDCLQRSNTLLHRSTDPQKFATLFYGILNMQKHQVCYANAGHNRPLFITQDKEPEFLELGGIALSFMENFIYQEKEILFKPGDMLLIYSDGITESMNTSNEEFGEENLVALAKENIEESADGLIKKIIDAVQKHAGDEPQSDDMTIVVIKRDKK